MTREPRRAALVLTGGAGGVAVAFEDGIITATGAEVGEIPADVERVDVDGALILPAFTDAHVHTVRTGFALTGLDVSGQPSLAATLDALADHATRRPDAAVLVGQGWDETAWPEHRPPTGAELDRAAPGRRTYLNRIDGHSSILSPALAALVPGIETLDGWSDDGRVERAAHHAARAALETLIDDAARLDAARTACRAMAAVGIGSFHENASPLIGPESEVVAVRQAAEEVGLRATVYWGELQAIDTARRLRVAGLAGDLTADGAFGSRTAALSAPYADAPGSCGHGYLTAEQVRDHVVACDEAGIQAGFHVIGDAALEEVAAGFELADQIRPVRPGHRLEHVELPSPRVIATMARLGIIASVQPMFDGLWGGPGGMYAERLGERWAATNPFAALHDAGVPVAFGSDSPVTPLGPWAAIRAAIHHRNPEHALCPTAAFAAHTGGAELVVGAPADLAIWHTTSEIVEGLPTLAPGEDDRDLPTLVRLIVDGRTVHPTDRPAEQP
ncbi:amidohydrolase [Nocardioides sp. GXZ039]|uniref:amidohydrolase n=1 Tax=Nocardioides sp. GXZ039 TaxID=3136018 RepID=UPI0030F38202